MPNINLKSVAVGVVLISVLIIAGAFIFTFFQKSQITSSKPEDTIIKPLEVGPREPGSGASSLQQSVPTVGK